MKKIMILLAVAALIFVSCGNKAQQVPEVEEKKCCTTEMIAKWDTFAELDEEGQIELVAEMKAFFDKKFEKKCKKEKTEECGEAKEVCPEKAAKCAEFTAQWENFENLPLEEQKCIIDQVIEFKTKCCKEKEACKKEVEEEVAE
jgi:hypothetical protein